MRSVTIDDKPRTMHELQRQFMREALAKQDGHCAYCPTPIDLDGSGGLCYFGFTDLAPDGVIATEVDGQLVCLDNECRRAGAAQVTEPELEDITDAEYDAWWESLADSLHRNEDGRVVMRDAEGQRYDSIDENGGSARDWGWFCGATAFYGHRKDVTACIDWDSLEDGAQYRAGLSEWDYIINYGIGHGLIDLRSTGDGHYRQRTYTEPVETFPELES